MRYKDRHGRSARGELAFGLNYEIDRFTHDILFDEKIGGTMHMALGSSFKKLGGRNDSGLHWDRVLNPGSPTERRGAPVHSMLVLTVQGSRITPELVTP